MKNVIKINTEFAYPIEGTTPIHPDELSVYGVNLALDTTNGETVVLNGYVLLSQAEFVRFATKQPYYVHGYAIYRGDTSTTPSTDNFVEYVKLDGSPDNNPYYDVTSLDLNVKDSGNYIMVQLVKNPKTEVTDSDIEDFIIT